MFPNCCFYIVGVLFLGVLTIRVLLLGVYIRAPGFEKLTCYDPHNSYSCKMVVCANSAILPSLRALNHPALISCPQLVYLIAKLKAPGWEAPTAYPKDLTLPALGGRSLDEITKSVEGQPYMKGHHIKRPILISSLGKGD